MEGRHVASSCTGIPTFDHTCQHKTRGGGDSRKSRPSQEHVSSDTFDLSPPNAGRVQTDILASTLHENDKGVLRGGVECLPLLSLSSNIETPFRTHNETNISSVPTTTPDFLQNPAPRVLSFNHFALESLHRPHLPPRQKSLDINRSENRLLLFLIIIFV